MKKYILSKKRFAKVHEDIATLKHNNLGLQRKIKSLEADIFGIKFPNGKLELSDTRYIYGCNMINLTYAYSNEITNTRICYLPTGVDNYHSSKILNNDRYFYLAIRYEHENKLHTDYYIVDKADGKVIECGGQKELDNIEWVLA